MPGKGIIYLVWIGQFVNFGIYYYIVQMVSSRAQADQVASKALPLAPLAAVAGVALVGGILLSLLVLPKRPSFTLYVISLGMVNTCALLGLIYAIGIPSAKAALPFMIAAAIGVAFCFPRFLAEAQGPPEDE